MNSRKIKTLSHIQKRIYQACQIDEGWPTYNQPTAFHLKGGLNVDEIEDSLKTLVKGHPELGTKKIPLFKQNFSSVRKKDRMRKALEFLESLSRKPIPLDSPPFIQVSLAILGKKEYLILFNWHLIAADSHSSRLFLREFSKLYNQPKSTTKLQDRKINVIKEEKRGAAYWKKHLEGANFSLELPKTSLQPHVDIRRGDTVNVSLSSPLSRSLRALAKQQRVSLFRLLQAAFGGFLYRYTGQKDFIIGYPVDLRAKGQKDQLGVFINTVPMRFQVQPEMSFIRLLKQTQAWHQKAKAYKSCPYEEIVKKVGIKEQHLREPLFNVYFDMERQQKKDLQLFGIQSEEIHLETGTSKFDLSLLVTEEEKKLHLTFEYPIALQSQEFVERMADNFQVFLKDLIARPKAKIRTLNLLSSQEKKRLLDLAPGPKTAYPRNKSVVDVFETIVSQYPKNTAMRFKGKKISYDELNKRANQLAHHLRKFGLKKQDYVGIYLERSIDLFVGILGILKAGGIYVPIDASYPRERKLYMIKDTGLKILITHSTLSHQFPAENLDLILMDEVDLSPYKDKNLGVKIKPLDLAFINYTSGTTGNPKGVQLFHRCINRLVTKPSWVKFTSKDRFLQITNISFDVLAHELWGAFLNGATLCIYPQIKLSPDELGKFIEEEKVTQIVFTARLFTLMVEEALESLKGVRCICSVGDVMSAKHAKIAFESLPSCQITNACGHTENTTHTTAYDVLDEEEIEHEVPIGHPIGHTTTYILDQNRQLVPYGCHGELCTGGDGLAKGYLNLPEKTAEKFILNPFGKGRLYRTGDLVRYLPDGNLSFLGRIDTQVKIRGFRIELSSVEEVMRSFSKVSDCITMAREDTPAGKQLVAYVTSSKNLEEEELRNWVSSKLPSYMVPSFFVILKKFPMTPNGKVDRKAFKAPTVGIGKKATLKTETEKTIASIWEKSLHLESVHPKDHFFKIGGDSINAMQVASQLKRIFRGKISVATLFEHPILADLASTIDSIKKSDQETIPKRKKFSPVSLSFNQESIWLIDQLGPHAKLQYMILYAYQIKGKLHPSKLQKSLEKVINRHEILRTHFNEKNGECMQWIESEGKDFFHAFEVSDEKEAIGLLQERLAHGMDLDQLPLLQVLLYQVKPNHYLMGIRVHHIIFDVLSYENFFREWTAFYASRDLPKLPIQYGDYALWQRKRLNDPQILKQLDFWKDHLKGAVELLELPWDKPRPPHFLGKGATETTRFSKELSHDLKKLAKREGVTLYVLIFAIFKVFLHRVSGKEDIVVGSPYANRSRGELDPLIGYFLQMFAIRSDLSENPEFSTVLSNLNATMSNCYKNGDIALEMVVNALNPSRDASFNPLFQVLFVLENITLSSIEFEGARLSPIPYDTNTAKFDLSLFVFDREEGLECRFEYCTDLFEKETIIRMFSQFQMLLKGVVKNLNEKIGFLPLLGKEEQQQIIVEWNQAPRHYPQNRSIPSLFEEIAKTYSDHTAVRFCGKSMSYRELNEKGNQFARYLQSLGVKYQDFVGVYLERSDDLIVVILGILKLGAVYVPIDASYPMERKHYMIEHTELNVLMTHRDFIHQFPKENIQLIIYEEGIFSSYATSNLKVKIDPKDLSHINYTSGSSGKPKGVEYTHLGIIRLLMDPTWMSIGDRDCMLQISNISFDMLAAEVWGALLNGATLSIYPQREFSAHELGEFLVDEQISHLFLTARLFVLMVEEGLEYLKNVRFFSSTGDAMSAHHAKIAYETLPDCQIVNAYGPTESHITTVYHVHSDDAIVPIGRPVPGTQVYVLDGNFQPVPIGVHGELCIGGDGLARGYLKDPKRTDEKFIPNPFGEGKLYRSGDLVRHLPNGTIEFLGRIDSQVKILGFRIELDEVEEVIRDYPNVSDCIAIAKEMTSNDKHLVVYIEPKEGEALVVDELRKYASSKLPKHALPSYYVLLDQFPLTPNGKIDKRKLPLPTKGFEERAFDPPKTLTEKKLAKIWSQLLKIPKISREDNFFHTGGHSILAMQLHSKVKDEFKGEIPVSLIFEDSTLGKYALSIDQILTSGAKARSDCQSFDLWREKEVVLDPSITIEEASPVTKAQYTHPKKIFLTGTTGFVGAFFLKDLIEKTEAKVYCLVRAKTEKEALKRQRETLQKYFIWKPHYEKRIVAIPGRLEASLLGLESEYFETLATEIDSIFHIGAFVNHAMSYEQHKGANVLGTEEVLRLASMHQVKPLHFISTVAVVEGIKTMPVPEDVDIDKSTGLSNGYVESKWVGEKLIHSARSRGIPCNIFRLPRVSGDSITGSGPKGDFLWRLVQASIKLKMAPEVDLYDDLTPVDYICDALWEISKEPNTINKEYHMVSPYPLLYSDVFQWLKKFGYRLKFTDFNTWKEALVKHSLQTEDAALQALASLLADANYSEPIQKLDLASDHLKGALKKSGLQCPKVDEKLFKKYVDYYVSIGFLPKIGGEKRSG